MKLDIIVPVSPHEPLSLVEKSFESLSQLEHGNLNVHMTYVIDVSGKDPRVEFLQSKNVNIIARPSRRGRRAGAINDALDSIYETDYLAFFDVDSRPERDFLIECTKALRDDVVIASAPRYVTNPEASVTARIVSAEYNILSDLYRLLERCDGFKQFNGLIGILDARIFTDRRLNESAACEDIDLMQELYLEGKTAAFVDTTRVGEQSPIYIRDYYHQRVRWLAGAYEGLRNFSKFKRAKIPMSGKITWFSAMIIPFFISLFCPLVILYGIRLWQLSNGTRDFTIKLFGLIMHAWILQICGLAVLYAQLFNMSIKWKEMHRSNV
ncbi:MAG: glycosyltransferase family 2 protein [Methanosarcinales archaeon]|nr:MAG: glycosyltransferase family 2 protein [Methanosarcinales archaeon]